MSLRREVFRRIGLFRPDLGRTGSSGEGEDTEFSMRIKGSLPEAIILYEPDAVMYHKVTRQRASLKYVIRRSFDGGFALAKIRRGETLGPQATLSAERNYLRYLLTTALPERIRHIYEPQVIAQMAALLAMVAARSIGYLVGCVSSPRKVDNQK